jgi:hypothetical protein
MEPWNTQPIYAITDGELMPLQPHPQNPTGDAWPFPWPADQIARYTAYRTPVPPILDGKLDEAVWAAAPRSPHFRDLISGEARPYATQAALLWDDTHLYVGYWVEEPDVQATHTARDALIYTDNDVELFIAGADAYYEFEINAHGTIYEVFFVWEDAYQSQGYHQLPDLARTDPGCRPFPGVGFRPHPRGDRLGFWEWDFPGLRSAVWVDGTINDARDRDRGWTVELALPWAGMELLARGDGRKLPPQPGDLWQMDFARFNTYRTGPAGQDSGGWAWSPHGVWDSHVPELFVQVTFSDELVKLPG